MLHVIARPGGCRPILHIVARARVVKHPVASPGEISQATSQT